MTGATVKVEAHLVFFPPSLAFSVGTFNPVGRGTGLVPSSPVRFVNTADENGEGGGAFVGLLEPFPADFFAGVAGGFMEFDGAGMREVTTSSDIVDATRLSAWG